VRAPRLGRRRAVILPLQFASAATLAVLALAATPGSMWALCIAVLVINLLSSTQDIATDGLAVEILSESERGLGNGLQVGAYRIGMIIGGAAMLRVFSHAGWEAAFLAMAGALVISTIPIWLHREAPAPERAASSPGFAELRAAFARPGLARWFVVLATYKTGEWFASGMLRTFLSDEKQSLDDISLMLGVVGFSAALVGALLGGYLVVRIGRRRGLLLFGALQAAAIASMALAATWPSVPMFYAVATAEHLTSAMATAALFTVMMDFARPTHAGVDYTVQACVVVIATGTAAALSGVSAEALGYQLHFCVAAALSAIAVGVVAAYRPAAPELTLK
jgi:MFS transporter, PAT family, beta-lactamase induction signal transducer AmpG